MGEILIALAFLLQSPATAQKTVERPNVWQIAWRLATDSNGEVVPLPVLSWAAVDPPVRGAGYSAPPEIAVVAVVDKRYRDARSVKDRGVLDKTLSAEYYETDDDGRRRDKATAIAYAMDESVGPVNDSPATARATGNVVVLTGEETATAFGVTKRVFFTHVYSRDADGDWRLVSVTRVRARI